MKERTKAILFELISKKYLTVEILSERYKVTPRTIRNELKEINNFIEKKENLCLENNKKKGLYLSGDAQEISHIKVYLEDEIEDSYLSPEERYLDIILNISLSSNAIYAYNIEKKLGISKSTLDDDMKKVRKILNAYNLKIRSIPKKGLLLVGEERLIRLMLFSVLNKYAFSGENFLLENQASKIKEIIFSYLSEERFKIIFDLFNSSNLLTRDPLYKRYSIIFSILWLLRISNGYTIKNSSIEKGTLSEINYSNLINKIENSFDVIVPEIEVKYFCFILETLNKGDVSSIEWTESQFISIELIQHVSKITDIPFYLEEEKLYEGLCNHISGLLIRMKRNMQVANPLTDNIKANYSNVFFGVSSYSKRLQELTGKSITEDEIAFLCMYFSASILNINSKQSSYFKVAVICNHGVATANLLSENLKKIDNIEIEAILSTSELSNLELLDVDLVFSTVPINYIKKPVMLLSPFIGTKESVAIQKFFYENKVLKRNKKSNRSNQFFREVLISLEDNNIDINNKLYEDLLLIFEQHNHSIEREVFQPMMENILKDDYIQLNIDVKSWEDSIFKVAQPLLNDQIIKKDYITAMIDSVNQFGPYIVIGKNIALAHARPEDGVNELGISVATIPEGIDFGDSYNNPVKIIFCLAAVDNYSHLNIMKELVELINDEDKLATLVNEKNVNEFKKILFEENDL